MMESCEKQVPEEVQTLPASPNKKELTDFKQKSVSSNFLFMNNTRMLPKRCHECVLKLKNPYAARLFAIFGIIPTR